MIASISLGIAVDACIHYVVRFREELRLGGSREAAVPLAHQSIGKAILYTAVIAAGLPKYMMLAASIPKTRSPNCATFRYTSRMRRLGQVSSMRAVK